MHKVHVGYSCNGVPVSHYGLNLAVHEMHSQSQGVEQRYVTEKETKEKLICCQFNMCCLNIGSRCPESRFS